MKQQLRHNEARADGLSLTAAILPRTQSDTRENDCNSLAMKARCRRRMDITTTGQNSSSTHLIHGRPKPPGFLQACDGDARTVKLYDDQLDLLVFGYLTTARMTSRLDRALIFLESLHIPGSDTKLQRARNRSLRTMCRTLLHLVVCKTNAGGGVWRHARGNIRRCPVFACRPPTHHCIGL